MSNQKEVLSDELLRARILELEYKGLNEQIIRRFYYEEAYEELDVEIDIYHSEDYIDEKISNGFNGTIIHFYDEDKEINQIYTIPRGTEINKEGDWRPLDETYDLMGLFMGKNIDQYQALEDFEGEVIDNITDELKRKNSSIDLEKIGLGHSLGGALIILLQLANSDYDNIYPVNAAPPSVYKMILVDEGFLKSVRRNFNLNPNNPNAIYELDAKELEEFAEDYYKDAGAVIKHTTTKQDLLQAIIDLRGFFKVGDYPENPIDAYPKQKVESLATFFEKFPESLVKDLQIYLAKNLSGPYNEDGFDGLLRDLTGVDSELVDHVIDIRNGEDDTNFVEKFGLIKDAYTMLKDVMKKVPELLIILNEIKDEVPTILDTLVETKYISEAEKREIITEIDGFVEDLEAIQESGSYLLKSVFKDIKFTPTIRIDEVGEFIKHILLIKERLENRHQRIDVITDALDDFFDELLKGGEAHKMYMVIKALSFDENKEYKDGDLIIYAKHGSNGKSIEVNASSAIRLHTYGMNFLNQKEKLLKELIAEYEMEYLEDYERRKRNLLNKIHDMESHPYRYQHLLGQFTPDAKTIYRVSSIQVDEDIPNLPNGGFKDEFEDIFGYVQKEIDKERNMLRNFENAITDLIKEEKVIAESIY